VIYLNCGQRYEVLIDHRSYSYTQLKQFYTPVEGEESKCIWMIIYLNCGERYEVMIEPMNSAIPILTLLTRFHFNQLRHPTNASQRNPIRLISIGSRPVIRDITGSKDNSGWTWFDIIHLFLTIIFKWVPLVSGHSILRLVPFFVLFFCNFCPYHVSEQLLIILIPFISRRR